MSMDKREAVTFIARCPRSLIAVPLAREIAGACGVTFDLLLYVEPGLVRTPKRGDLVLEASARNHVLPSIVQVSELGATIARYMDLYADKDHALQSPHGTLGKQADYVGQRAAIRLARTILGGEPGVEELYKDVPWIPKVLRQERLYKI